TAPSTSPSARASRPSARRVPSASRRHGESMRRGLSSSAVGTASESMSSPQTATGSSPTTSAARSAVSSSRFSGGTTRSARRGRSMACTALLSAAACLFLCSGVRAATVIVVTGRGWGHGVGMSQWGARGYALHGWSFKQILGHYYPGTELASTPNVTVRVLLAASQPGAAVACAAGMKVGDATGRTFPLPAKTYDVGPGLLVRKHRLRSPIAFYCSGGPLVWDGRAYHGTLVVWSGRGRLAVVNAVDLEDYVRGVIGDEMPHRWPLAALEAQAVAARSYALATLHPRRRFDLFADDRSQVYGGMGAETPGTVYAATQTEGKILMYGGHVATTYFFSTSGGRTADVRDVWPR